jgi:Ras family protein T1
MFASLKLTAPVVLACNKTDAIADVDEAVARALAQATRDPSAASHGVILSEMSVLRRENISRVLSIAQRAVLYPVTQLFDFSDHTFTAKAATVFLRMFRAANTSGTGALSDEELRAMQMKVFGLDLPESEIADVKAMLREGNNGNLRTLDELDRVTYEGFLVLMLRFITRMAFETVWAFLRAFHYNDVLDLDLNIPQLHHEPDQIVELSPEARDFLMHTSKSILASLLHAATGGIVFPFLTTPQSIEDEANSSNPSAPSTKEREAELAAVTYDEIMAQFDMLAVADYGLAGRLIAIAGYDSDDFGRLFKLSKRRAIERKTGRISRSVFTAFVFGSPNSGKSTLLKRGHAVRVEGKYTVVFREFPEQYVDKILQSAEALAQPDCCVLVYDGSDPFSFQYISQVHRKLLAVSPSTPCVFAITKTDADLVTQEFEVSPEEYCRNQGLPWPPVLTAAQVEDFGNFFDDVLQACLHPELCLPTGVSPIPAPLPTSTSAAASTTSSAPSASASKAPGSVTTTAMTSAAPVVVDAPSSAPPSLKSSNTALRVLLYGGAAVAALGAGVYVYKRYFKSS